MARDGFMVSRSIFDHDVFRQKRKFSRLEAWVWMLAEAAWKPRKVEVAGQSVTLARGQFCHSLRFIGTAWGWEKDAVARFMNRLKTETMIATETETGQMVVTICNYDEYQLTPSTERDSTATASETSPRQHRDSTATNENKDNQVINKSKDSSLRSLGDLVGNDDVQLAFDDWNKLAEFKGLPKATTLNAKRKASIRQRLEECGGREGWQDALRMIPQSPFLMGDNNTGFTATLDFVLQASSFTKLREGNYAKRGNGPTQPQPKGLAAIRNRLQKDIENGSGQDGARGADGEAVQRLPFFADEHH